MPHHVVRGDKVTRKQRRPGGLTAVRIQEHATTVLIAGGLLLVTACGGGGESGSAAKNSPPAKGTSRPPAASARTDPQAQARADVLRAYDGFWDAQVKAYAQASIKGTDLEKYATKKALGRAMGDVLVMQKADTAATGAPTHDAKVTSLVLTGATPKATVRDCLDISNWKTVTRKTRAVRPFPSNQPLRYVTTVKAEKWGKQWMITEVTPDGTHTC
ncbi:hypothetical protein [Streptomyces sp. NPDC096013]|uniref:hypothetical protein n=1 Tax=Streptomyces sp. NPDC096013 TaxID=3366069 RepID=UPI0038013D0C